MIGICSAYFLAVAGHEVAVIERRASVAEEASFGNAGIIAPGNVAPWASPGMPARILSSLFKPQALSFRLGGNRALWRWLRKCLPECEAERYLRNRERMQRLASYSQRILHDLLGLHQLEYENTSGVLQLFRTAQDLELNAPTRALLAEQNIAHQLLDAAAARRMEPALAPDAPLAGALHLPDGEAGNCPLFAKQLRQVAQSMGVQFHFQVNVDAIVQQGERIGLRIGDEVLDADAVVLAAGADSAPLLRPLGVEVPLYPVKGYSITVPIKNFDAAPLAALLDDTYQAAITRIGNRIRIAGLAELGASHPGGAERALRMLSKLGDDWFPGAASYQAATLWGGVYPMLPDGAPLLGATRIRNLFVNIGHGAAGWAMAAGSGKILADLMSRQPPEIDLDGLTLARYG